MKTKYVLILAALLLAAPAWAQPVPEPKAKAPVTKKAEPKVATPVAAPVEAKKPEVKTEGKVELVEPKAEEKPAEKPPGGSVGTTPPPVDAEGGESYAGVAIKHAIGLGFLLLTLLLSGLVKVLLTKFGFESQNAKVQEVLQKGAGYAEQWAKKKAKVEGAAAPGGPEKMDKAVVFALDLAKDYKLPDKGKQWWEDQLEGWLGMRNGA